MTENLPSATCSDSAGFVDLSRREAALSSVPFRCNQTISHFTSPSRLQSWRVCSHAWDSTLCRSFCSSSPRGKKPLLSPIYVNMSSISSHGQSVLGFNGAFAVRARVEGLRDFGACQNPFGAFLLLQVNDAGTLSQGFKKKIMQRDTL